MVDHFFCSGEIPEIPHAPIDKKRPEIWQTKIILVDELDYLITKDQSVLYNLFEWPQRKKSNLIVISVANTLDLPENFMARISSRIGNTRLVFTPYTSNEIRQIINQRVEEIGIFDANAINFISKKIALISSDIRKTLAICRQAVDRYLEECKKADLAKQGRMFEERNKITMDLVSRVFDNNYSESPLAQFVSRSNDLFKAIFTEMYLETKTNERRIATFGKVFERYKNSPKGSVDKLTAVELMAIMKKLAERNIIKMSNNRVTNLIEIDFVSTSDDIAYALRDDPYFSKKLVPTVPDA